MLNISQNPAITGGLITVEHSIPSLRSGDSIDPSKVRYCVVSPHSPSRDFTFPDKVAAHLPQDSELFKAYTASENDAGIYQLTKALLDKCP